MGSVGDVDVALCALSTVYDTHTFTFSEKKSVFILVFSISISISELLSTVDVSLFVVPCCHCVVVLGRL